MFSNPILFQMVVLDRNLELHLFGLLCVLFSSFIYPLYILSMVRGEQCPPRSTWFLWLLLDVVAFVTRWQAGIFDVQLVIYTIGTLVVAFYTLWYGKNVWEKVDTFSAVAVAVAITAWGIIGPAASTVCALGGLTIAAWPLLQDVYSGKYASRAPWLFAIIGSVFNWLDGQILTGAWFTVLQVLILIPIVYHWGWTHVPSKK